MIFSIERKVNYCSHMRAENVFSDWFNRQLARRDLTQADFIRVSGLSSSTVSQWSTAKRIPKPAQCERIADALHIEVDTVLEKAGHRPQIEALSADDPRRELMGMLRRINFTDHPDWEELVRKDLTMLIDWQARLKSSDPS